MRNAPAAIDLNADLGEGFSHDSALLALVTSASIACGAHAGDRKTVGRTLRAVKQGGVVVGAHPGFADRDGFGRREQAITAATAADLVLAQVAWLVPLALEAGLSIRFVKPHGALYNQAQRDREAALGILSAMARLDLPILGQPGSVLARLAPEAGVRFIAEGFPDRRYLEDGRLLPRTEPGAVLTDPAAIEAQVVRLIEDGIDTLCIHGDDPRAVENARTVRAVVERRGLGLSSFA